MYAARWISLGLIGILPIGAGGQGGPATPLETFVEPGFGLTTSTPEPQ